MNGNEFDVGNILYINGRTFEIEGKIRFQCLNDNTYWNEYRLIDTGNSHECWLSYDDEEDEFAFMYHKLSKIPRSGFHKSDAATEIVDKTWGNVDAEVGQYATCVEYEDDQEERVISVERWQGRDEIYEGCYLDPNEVRTGHHSGNTQSSSHNYCGYSYDDNYTSGYSSYGTERNATQHLPTLVKFVVAASFFAPFVSVVFFGIFASFATFGNFIQYGDDGMYSSSYVENKTELKDYIKTSSDFKHIKDLEGTSTGLGAQVYQSSIPLEKTAKIILEHSPEFTKAQQNYDADDNSIAILSPYEYCFIYETPQKQIYIQISSREYAYADETTPYNAGDKTITFYRAFYYNVALPEDRTTYTTRSSPHSIALLGFANFSYNPNNSYQKYSNKVKRKHRSASSQPTSVRRHSTRTRSSMGGGTSFGK